MIQSLRVGLRLALAVLLFSSPAFAQGTNDGLPVIAAGRETDILRLIKPYGEQPLAPGWSLGNTAIGEHTIRFSLQGPGGKACTVLLGHPKRMSADPEHTASFAVQREGGDTPDATAAMDAFVKAIQTNDGGGFWPAAAPSVSQARRDARPSGPSWWERAVASSVDVRNAWGQSSFSQMSVRGALSIVAAALGDGIVLFALAMTLLLAHLRRVLKNEAGWVPFGLAGLVLLAGVLRLVFSREAPMNAWPYERIVPIARRTFEGLILPMISQSSGRSFDLTEVIFKWDLLLATITPLAFFAHARYVLRDVRSAFVGAAILTVLPNHLHFSRADSEFIQSLATSSLTFVVLYTALRESSPNWRALCFVLLPLFCTATYFVRPENMVFYVIDIGAILLTSGLGVPKGRQLLALGLVSAAAAFAWARFLLVRYSQNIHEGLSLQTLANAAQMVFSPTLNTLINVSITPPGLTLLAGVGAVFLVRRGERKRALFLVGWLAGFFLVHSYVRPTAPEMQARYHMHLITPLLLLAAAATPDLLTMRRWVPVTIGVYLALSPILHVRFIGDTQFNEMQEFLFLREQRPKVPIDCTVLEFSPAVDPSDPNHVFASRWGRMGARLADGRWSPRWKVINSGKMTEPGKTPEAHETLTPEALEVIEKPPECLYVYEGLSCYSHRPEVATMAPVCADLRERLDLEPVASVHIASRVYDEVNAGRVYTLEDGRTEVVQTLKPGEDISLILYRARVKGAAGAGAETDAAGRNTTAGSGQTTERVTTAAHRAASAS